MEAQATWVELFLALLLGGFGLYFALTTHLGPRPVSEDSVELLSFRLKKLARNGGWLVALGGLIGAVRTLLVLFGDSE
jgi:hypothetical protein